MSILSLVRSGNGFASGRLSYVPSPSCVLRYYFGICVSVRMYKIIRRNPQDRTRRTAQSEVKIAREKRRKIASFEKDGPIRIQYCRREKTDDRIIWTDPPGQRIGTVEEQSNTPSTVIATLKLASVDCHRHVNAIKKYLEA